jgi:serine/threonine protein kinase
MLSDPMGQDKAAWARVKEIFLSTLDQPEGEQTAFVLARTEENTVERHTVLEMLHQHQRQVPGLEEDPATPALPQVIGPYQVTQRLASTATATVLLGERNDGKFTQKVVIKVLEGAAWSEQSRQRLLNERTALAELQHPSICRLLDVGELAGRQPYLVLEWIAGQPLLDYARQRTLEEKLLLFREACLGVEAAHRRFIVHRDLKPAHLLVTESGQLKILDFGIAKLLPESGVRQSVETQYGQSPLTPAYASPEQWRGEAATAGFDVFSLGVVLFELLTGRHPFGPSPALPHEWAARILEGEPAMLSEFEGSLRGDLSAIAIKSVAKVAGDRYATVEDFRRDIEAFLERRPVSARGNDWRYASGLWFRRNRKFLLPLGLSLFFLLVLSAQWWQRRQAQAEAVKQAQTRAERLIFKTFSMLATTSAPVSVRRELLDAAIDQLEAIEATELSSQLEEDRARMYATIGGILGEAFGEHLEDFDAAAQYALKSRALWERRLTATGDPRFVLDWIRTEALLGDIYFGKKDWPQSKAHYQAAARRIRTLPADVQRAKGFDDLFTVMESMQGDILLLEGRAAEALAIQLRVLQARERLQRERSGPEADFGLGNVRTSMAQAQEALGNLEGAVQEIRLARQHYERAKAEKPNQPDAEVAVIRERAKSAIYLGDLLRKLRRGPEAEQAYREAKAALNTWRQLDPGSLARQRLADSLASKFPR